MKNFLNNFFVVLGVIFLVVILLAAYFFVTDPYNLKPLIFGSSQTTTSTEGNNKKASDDSTTAKPTAEGVVGFQLTEAQKQALVSLGIDPASVPATISAEQEACFVAALGESTVNEIKAGAVPNVIEFAKAKSCI